MYISEQLLDPNELDPGRERFMAFALGYTRGLLQAAGVWSTPRR
jgi:mannonate dehydratase